MHRFSTSLLGIGVLAVVSCGAPAELDEDSFPELTQTGYDDGAGSGGSLPVAAGGAGGGAANGVAPPAAAPPASNAGALPPAAAGTGAGVATSPTPGNDMPAAGAGAPTPLPAAGGEAAGGEAAGAGAGAGGCPDDITLLFNRPITEGGCNGSACHVAGATVPDLVSPNPEQRLLNVQSQCNGRPYIGADDSFLVDKISGSPPECGLAMPFFMPQALSAEDEACIIAWVAEVSGG